MSAEVGTVTIVLRPKTAAYHAALRRLRRRLRNMPYRLYLTERPVESARRRRVDRAMAARDRRTIRRERRAS